MVRRALRRTVFITAHQKTEETGRHIPSTYVNDLLPPTRPHLHHLLIIPFYYEFIKGLVSPWVRSEPHDATVSENAVIGTCGGVFH